MKFFLFILVFLMLANLLEAQRNSCRERPGVLKIIKETLNNDPSSCHSQTGNYYRIEGTAANEKTQTSNLRQYQKGNPRPLKEVKEFRVQNCRRAEDAARRAVGNLGNTLAETEKWFLWKGDEESLLSIIENATKNFMQDADINRSLSILKAIIEKYKDDMDMLSSVAERK